MLDIKQFVISMTGSIAVKKIIYCIKNLLANDNEYHFQQEGILFQ